MTSDLGVLLLPFLACLVLVSVHTYLGLHVIARKVLFVDLALAQIAALGQTLAFMKGYEAGSTVAYVVALLATAVGAGVFALTRARDERVPQEAVIGLVFAVASAATILLAAGSPHGAEHLKDIMAGSIVWVNARQIWRAAALYAAVGLFHWFFRERFILISSDPEAARAKGLRVRFWDFLFYLSFGVVITTSVQIAGILMVFCLLIAPAVLGFLFADTWLPRLLIGWAASVVACGAGLVLSFDQPTGPMIICVFAAILVAASVIRAIKTSERAGSAIAILILSILAIAGGIVAWNIIPEVH